jgi:hypothetical protein
MLIRRMAAENVLWGQKRIQVELAKLGYPVSARTIARYMRDVRRGAPSSSWRNFLSAHSDEIWACEFFCVQTILFRTIYVFSSFTMPAGRLFMFGRPAIRPANGRGGKLSRRAAGIVNRRVLSSTTAIVATERPFTCD